MGKRKVFGPVVVVTADFRRDLLAWLRAPGKGRSARRLALTIGCDPSMISQLLNNPDDIKTSTLVLPIVQATGIAMPTEAQPDEFTVMLDQLRRLREVDRATFDAIVALINARLGEK